MTQDIRSNDTRVTGLLRFAVVAAALVLAGCSTPMPMPEPVEPAPEPVPIVIIPVPEPVEPTPEPTPPAVLRPVAIVLTSNQPAYADVARELARLLDSQMHGFQIYDLSDESRPPITVLRLINDSDSGPVVAIGLRAARSSVAMSDRPVVFSQVFNYQDYNLLNENSRGVAASAPIEAQLAAWKEADPTISRIGAIVGEGHDELIAEAEIAAAKHGVELRVQVTRSDQETLYFFKRMVRDIDGFWLFPDNRVFSLRALQQIMDDAQRHQVSVLAPSESMLQTGASISVTSVASDIATTIAQIVQQIEAGNLKLIPRISPLSEIRVKTSNTVRVVER